jgi:lipopolysaccharide transport system ATP-binding protein
MLLYRGATLAEGDPADVVNRYNGLVLERQKSYLEAALPAAAAAQEWDTAERLSYSYRHGDGQAVVLKTELFNEAGQPARVLQSGEQVRVRVLVQFRESHPHPVIGIMIRTRIGMEVYGTNTELSDASPGRMDAANATGIHSNRGHTVGRRREPRLAG